jgi:hypothetical protein
LRMKGSAANCQPVRSIERRWNRIVADEPDSEPH